MSAKSKKILIIIAVAVLVFAVSGGAGYGYYYYNNKDKGASADAQSSQSDSSTEDASMDSNSDQNASENKVPNDIFGAYKGQGAVVSGAFQFPDSTFRFNEDTSFDYDAKGLDLIVTQNPSLSVNGTYPIVNFTAKGKAFVTGNGSVVLNVEAIGIEFTIAGKQLDPATAQQLLATLQSALGFAIPEVSKDNPLKLNALVVLSDEGSIDIGNLPGQTNQLYISFSGARV